MLSCPDGTYCTGTANSVKGVCKALPDTVDADCSAAGKCNMDKGFYCSEDTKKCAALPKEDEECYVHSSGFTINYLCNVGLYCDYSASSKKCAPLGGAGNKCRSYSQCKDGLTCSNTGTCVPKTPDEGDYCSLLVACPDGYICSNSTCVKKDGTCLDYKYCK